MKKYFYSALAATMLFACSQEEIVDVTKGEGQKVTFKVEIPSVESRTVGGIEIGAGTQANALIYAMYENGGNATTPLISGVVYDNADGNDDGEFTVTVPMAKDLKYDLLFLAYNETNSAFDIATPAKDTDLKNLQFKANQTANIDAFDAFVGALKNQGVNDPNEVTLKRPFAQVNAATTLEDMNNAATLQLNVAQSQLVIKGVPASYNVLEATASTSTIDVTYAASDIMICDQPTSEFNNETITVDGTNYYYLTLAYVLAGETEKTSIHNATFQFLRADDTSVSTLSINNLPIQRNYRTNVIGDLLTKSEQYTIKIDAEFEGAHIVGVWDGTTDEDGVQPDADNILKIYNGSELAWIAAQVDGGETFAGKTVKLMNDIDLANIAWNPIGVSGDSMPFSGIFDGNGKTISNLYVDMTGEPLYESAGLFANASGATIKNFTIENAYVANKTVFGDSSCGTAIVVGSGQGTTIIDNVDVKNATIIADRYTGGIAGYYQGTITNCDVDGIEITVTPNQDGTGNYDNGDKVGGIIGYVNTSGTVTNNTVNNFTIRAYRDMGGIVGGNYADVDGNKATNGIITIDQRTNYYGDKAKNAGEIVGRQMGGTVGTNTPENVTIVEFFADGISKDPESAVTYYVSNANGLAALNEMMANKTAGLDVILNLTADIDFAGKTWTPVDSHADTAFEIAEINGNGHTISNFTINGQAMFTRFAGTGNVTIKDITFDNATVNSNTLNTSILTVQTYQNVLLDNVDVKNSSITGAYKVAPLIATVYNENPSTITATLKNCDVENVTVKGSLDFMICGMIAFVNEGNNDKIEFENCSVNKVTIKVPENGSYGAYGYIYSIDGDAEGTYNTANGVTISDCKVEKY